jgi:hypothetical protein
MEDYNNTQNFSKLAADLGNTEEVTEEQLDWSSMLSGIKNSGPIIKTHAALMTTESFLSKAEKYLDVGVSILEFATSITKLFALLEQAFNIGLWTIVQYIVDQIEVVINDIKSTGVYFIEFVSCFAEKDDLEILDDLGLPVGAWFEDEPTVPTTSITPKPESCFSRVCKQYGVSGLTASMGPKAIGDLMLAYKQDHDGVYQEQTYTEFINKVVNSFYDVNDTPNPEVVQQYRDGQAAKDNESNGIELLDWKSYVTMDKDMLKPGRPLFQEGADAWTGMIMFAVKNPMGLLTLLDTLGELMQINWDKNNTCGSCSH